LLVWHAALRLCVTAQDLGPGSGVAGKLVCHGAAALPITRLTDVLLAF
jgi:hypothetical protein